MKAKLSPNMISFVAVRRGEWILKISVFRNRQILLVAQNCYDFKTVVKYFIDQNHAAEFIEQLVIED
jgi:hypothetical protein